MSTADSYPDDITGWCFREWNAVDQVQLGASMAGRRARIDHEPVGIGPRIVRVVGSLAAELEWQRHLARAHDARVEAVL